MRNLSLLLGARRADAWAARIRRTSNRGVRILEYLGPFAHPKISLRHSNKGQKVKESLIQGKYANFSYALNNFANAQIDTSQGVLSNLTQEAMAVCRRLVKDLDNFVRGIWWTDHRQDAMAALTSVFRPACPEFSSWQPDSASELDPNKRTNIFGDLIAAVESHRETNTMAQLMGEEGQKVWLEGLKEQMQFGRALLLMGPFADRVVSPGHNQAAKEILKVLRGSGDGYSLQRALVSFRDARIDRNGVRPSSLVDNAERICMSATITVMGELMSELTGPDWCDELVLSEAMRPVLEPASATFSSWQLEEEERDELSPSVRSGVLRELINGAQLV